MFTKPVGIRVLILGLCLVVCTGCLTACPAYSDWEYDRLPNNYAIIRVNSESIVFGKNNKTFDQIIDRYIKEFCYNESYIALKRIPMDEISYNESVDIEDFGVSDIEFYLIDAMQDIIYGPYTADEYSEQCQHLDIGEMCAWIDTIDKPTH